MGKGDRRTSAKQQRKRFEAAAGVALAPAPRKSKPKAQGRARMKEIETEKSEDAMRTALTARARQMGLDPTDPAIRADMARQIAGDAAGRVLSMICDLDEAEALHGHWRAFCGARERYTRRVLLGSDHAKCGKMEMTPDHLQASAEDAPPDLRSEDERHRAAVNEWRVWQDALARAGLNASNIWAAYLGWADMHRDGAPTLAGRRFVATWRIVCAGV